jgi:phosphomannomutase
LAAADSSYERYCPGEEQIRISDAICLGRRRANYVKCPTCQFNEDPPGVPVLPIAAATKRMMPTTMHVRNTPMDAIDKVFKAYDVRAIYPDPLNEDIAWRIGNATAQFLRTALTGYSRSDPAMNKLIVGRDMRKSSPSLQQAFIEGAAAVGTEIIDIGMIDTSQLYFAVNHLPCCGGVQTTASHNPSNYNGFKICGQKGKPIGADSGLKEIQRVAAAIARYPLPEPPRVTKVDLSKEYRAFLHQYLIPPRPLRVVVDASNGMAGRWFPLLFDGVPNLTVIPINFTHDGEFVHPPNPLVEANLAQLKRTMAANKADLGACFDGDADRCIFVDERGVTARCDLVTALFAQEALRDHPNSAIVYDLRSSRAVRDVVLKAGGTPKRERVGHVFMKRAMAETGAVVGGELSGHFYFKDFFYCDSGMLSFIHVLNVMTRTGKPLSALLQPFQTYVGSGEQNFENDDKQGTFDRLVARYKDAEIDTLDGVTVQYPDWWFNVRASNTEPLLRLNLEANSQALLEQKLAELTPLLGRPAVEH